MDNQDEILKLVLSDEYLCKLYSINQKDYQTIDDALKSDNPAVMAVATIIRNVTDNTKSTKKEVYLQIVNQLTKHYDTKKN